MEYRANFTGRRKDAIGEMGICADWVEAPNEDAARLKLYDRWDHIVELTLTPVNKFPEFESPR